MISFWTWEAGQCKAKRCLWTSKEVCLLQAPLTALLTTSGLLSAELLAKQFDDGIVGVEAFCSPSLNTMVRKKYRNDKWHIECLYTSHSDCYEDIISPNLSGERKKGKVDANCHVFDWYGCVMNQLAQVPMSVKCLRQEMIACVVTRNSDDETQIFNTVKNIDCFFLSSATRAQEEQDVSPAACSNTTSASTATLRASTLQWPLTGFSDHL